MPGDVLDDIEHLIDRIQLASAKELPDVQRAIEKAIAERYRGLRIEQASRFKKGDRVVIENWSEHSVAAIVQKTDEEGFVHVVKEGRKNISRYSPNELELV